MNSLLIIPKQIPIFSKGYIYVANEGDSRFNDAVRVKDIPPSLVSPISFPNFDELRRDEHLGRLYVSKFDGVENGLYTKFYSFGSRSFSIFTPSGTLVYDSADHLEQMTAFASIQFFNSDGGLQGNFDVRSPVSGPEPEGKQSVMLYFNFIETIFLRCDSGND